MAIPTGPDVFKMSPMQLYKMIRDQGTPQTEYEKALTLAFLVIAKRVEKLAKMVVEHDQLIFGDDKEEAAAGGAGATSAPGAGGGGDKTPFPAGAAAAPGAPSQPTGAAQGELTPEQEAELVAKARGEAAPPPPAAKQQKPAQNGSGKAAQS